VPGMGNHLLRVRNIGASDQEVLIDGSLIDAPAGTTTFTGPGASLLELQPIDGLWTLLVDGAAVESYNPEAASTEVLPVSWWKFSMPGMGTHHVRVKNISSPGQEIFLDGTPLDAPEGTMTFTGPGGTLLELQKRDGLWMLVVDGSAIHQCNPNAESECHSTVWNFGVPGTGQHQMCISGMGTSAQQVLIDGIKIPAPVGQLTFTGPGGCLLELRDSGGSWMLLVDGAVVEAVSATANAAGLVAEASWVIFGSATGLAHEMRVMSIGGRGQQVYIDGTLIPGPEGQTAFTGPGGMLLELKQRCNDWVLFVDGQSIEDHNNRVTGALGASPEVSRAPVSSGTTLPQGVSYDAGSGKYLANIRVKGKFKLLGEFSTPDEAHARYLEEKSALGDA